MLPRSDSHIQRVFVLIFFLVFSPNAFGQLHDELSPGLAARYRRYYADTIAGMNRMRERSGLINDKSNLVSNSGGACQFATTSKSTSPTNIALDLLIQMNQLTTQSTQALARLELTVKTLGQLPFHSETGLFYSWYATDSDPGKPIQVISYDISSVDNVHLALALWTAHTQYANYEFGKQAGALFDRMDFSRFYDRAQALFGGNLRHHEKHGQPSSWTLDTFRYSYFGSESRSIYGLVYALELLKSIQDPDYTLRTTAAMKAEVFEWKKVTVTHPTPNTETQSESMIPVLRTWDGGAFQTLLPELLIGERSLSPELDRLFKNYSDYVLAQQTANHYSVPAGFSACSYELDGIQHPSNIPLYNGRVGSPELVSLEDRDINNPDQRELWDMVATPHAIFLAALSNPNLFSTSFQHMEDLKSGTTPLYCQNFGFLDGYFIKGSYAGHITPVQLSLDQGMIGLSIEHILAHDGKTVSARALQSNAKALARLRSYYSAIDEKLKNLRAGQF